MSEARADSIKHDIKPEDYITDLVHQFYTKVRQGALPGPAFNSIIKANWKHHLQVMCNFWSTILLYSKKYSADPMVKHLPIQLEKKNFNR